MLTKNIFRIPREKSSAGILTFSFLLAVFSSLHFKWPNLLIALISYLLFLLTFDFLFENSAKPFNINYIMIVLLDAVPIFIAIALNGMIVLLGILPSLICASIYLLYAIRRKGRSVQALVLGSSILAGFYYYFASILSWLGFAKSLIGFLLFSYNAAEVLYVESKLKFRNIDPKYSFAIFLTSFLAFIYLPLYFVLPLVEPSVRFFVNVFKNRKFSNYEEINMFGIKEFARYSLFFIFLCIITVIYEVKII